MKPRQQCPFCGGFLRRPKGDRLTCSKCGTVFDATSAESLADQLHRQADREMGIERLGGAS